MRKILALLTIWLWSAATAHACFSPSFWTEDDKPNIDIIISGTVTDYEYFDQVGWAFVTMAVKDVEQGNIQPGSTMQFKMQKTYRRYWLGPNKVVPYYPTTNIPESFSEFKSWYGNSVTVGLEEGGNIPTMLFKTCGTKYIFKYQPE